MISNVEQSPLFLPGISDHLRARKHLPDVKKTTKKQTPLSKSAGGQEREGLVRALCLGVSTCLDATRHAAQARSLRRGLGAPLVCASAASRSLLVLQSRTPGCAETAGASGFPLGKPVVQGFRSTCVILGRAAGGMSLSSATVIKHDGLGG